ncbi:MAG: Immunoglobulin I-set domain protein [Verrucomicrobiales bacterium]|nr:Immunoglobulin I-set domain protein [Verrucomicrobiales bacterium]
MKLFFFSAIVAVLAATSIPANAQTTKVLTPLGSFGSHADGSLRPGDVGYVSENTYQRGLAYNPATGNLIFIDRQSSAQSAIMTGSIYILNPSTGEVLAPLQTGGMGGGSYADISTSVSDDGVIYVCNMVNNASTNNFIIYRWDSEASGTGANPVVVYSGDPAPGIIPRWGETMDVRGSGATTQILIGSKSQTGGVGTNVVIFTATDASATSFVAHRLNTDLAASEAGTTGEPGMGVAFGSGNTFWTKHKGGAPLRQLSFDLATSTNATTVRIFSSTNFPGAANLGPVAVDTVNNLMALGDLSATNAVRLYDISDLSKPPVLLDIKTFPTASATVATATGMYLDFGGGKLYAHSINNGIMGFSIDSVSMDIPQFITQPSGTVRTLEGRSVSFEVLASQATSYQWKKNGANIVGATSPTINLTGVTTNNTGSYSVNIANAAGTNVATSSVYLSVVAGVDLFRLTPLWYSTVVGNVDTLNPFATNYINQKGTANTPNQRTFAYDAGLNHLLLVSRTNNASSLFNIYVINGTNGQYLYNLKTNGVTGGAISLVGIAAADDGSIYACSMENVTAVWKLYRWADSGSNTLPSLVFSGDPTGLSAVSRWGDVLTARGSGTNTQLLIDNNKQGTAVTPYMALLTPGNAALTNFTSIYGKLDTNSPMQPIGRSIQFGPNGANEMWYRSKASNLMKASFDPTTSAADAPLVAQYALPTSLGSVSIDFGRNLLAAIDFNGAVNTAPDSVALYEVSDLAAPILINRYNFTVNEPYTASANFISQISFVGDYVFALDCNNGLAAFKIESGPTTPPTIVSQPTALRVVSGQTGSLSVASPDATAFQWKKDGSNVSGGTASKLTFTSAQVTNSGSYLAVVSNSSGSITSSVVSVTVISSNDVYQLVQKWQYLPGTNDFGAFTNYVTKNGGSSTPNERSIAYNSLSNQLYIAQKSGSDFAVHAINANTGVEQYLLNTNHLFYAVPTFSGGSGLGIDAIGVADDGAIYGCNLTSDACGCTNANGVWRLYRWANSDPATEPVQVFQGDPAGQTTSLRWGDVMSVRGSGINTEIVVNNNQGTFGAVLRPTDGSMTTFTSFGFSEASASSPIGRSLQFAKENTNTIWQKRSGSDLQLLSYDLGTSNSTTVTNISILPGTWGPVMVVEAPNVVAGINFSASGSPDTVEMYDTSFTPMLLLNGYNFPITHQANQHLIGQVIVTANRVFAINGNNGVVAYDLIAPIKPQITLTNSANSITIAWPTALTGYGLQGTPALPVGWTNVTATITTNNGQNSVTLGKTGSAQYFRLKK